MREIHFFDYGAELGVRLSVLQKTRKLNNILPVMPVLVICPKQCEFTWQEEFKRFNIKGEIVSYQRALRYCEDARYKVEHNPTILVLDEPKVSMQGKKTREAVSPLIVAAEHVFVLN